jgi:hypothetical protein
MCLFDALLCEPLGEDVRHGLGREGHGEGELGVVARHRRDVLWMHEKEWDEERIERHTRSLGILTSIGLSGMPKSDTISRIRSER